MYSHQARPNRVAVTINNPVDRLMEVRAHFSRKWGIEISMSNADSTHKKIHFWDGLGILRICRIDFFLDRLTRMSMRLLIASRVNAAVFARLVLFSDPKRYT